MSKFLELSESNLPQSIDIRQAIMYVSAAWDSVHVLTISNCYIKTGITSNVRLNSDSNIDHNENDDPIELIDFEEIPTVEENLVASNNFESNIPTENILNDDEIIEIIQNDDCISSDEICDEESVKRL